MRLAEGSRVVTLARTAHDDEEAEDEIPEDDGEDLTEEELGAENEEGQVDGADESDE